MTTTLLKNIGEILSGDIEEPLASGDAVLVADGEIAAIGAAAEIEADYEAPDLVVDAGGTTLAPGLIDSHTHIVIGDYTPRQKTVDFLESYTHGGVSRCISASEVHAPGRPRDRAGVKALALTAQRCFSDYRPGGMTVHGGSIILEPGLVAEDFEELAREGVWLAKAGFGDFKVPAECAPLVWAAKEAGYIVMCHTGGASIPSSSPVTADDLLAMLPQVSGHVNGGPTSMSDRDIDRVIAEPRIALQIVQAGNLRSALKITDALAAGEELDRLLIATDTPTGTGMMPLGMIKSVTELASLAVITPEQAIAAATGNVARVYKLRAGRISVGYPADLMLLDTPLGSAAPDARSAITRGDLPAISCLFTSGQLRYVTSRNSPPPTREIKLTTSDERTVTHAE